MFLLHARVRFGRIGVLAALCGLAACGGHAGPPMAPSLAPASAHRPTSSAATATATASPIPLPSGVISATGQIGAISGSKITIQTGPGCGWMNVTVTSSTAYFDGTPQVGQYAVFTGTGTKCNSITAAASASLSATAFTSSTTSGTVTQATSYGFTMDTGSASVPVALTSSTVVFGSALTVGSNVSVTALGTPNTGLTATQVAVSAPPTPAPTGTPQPTPTPIARHHVLTFAYVYGYAGVPTTIPVSTIARFVNWTMTDEAHAAQLRSAHVKVQVYANFWRNYSSDNPLVGYTDLAPGGAHEAAEARDCSGNVIGDPSYGGGYEADAGSPSAPGHAQVVASYRLNQYAGNYDALFADDAGAVGGITQPCGYTQSGYDAEVNAVHASLATPMFINALGAAPNPATAVDLLNPSNVLGAMCELCYSTNGSSGDSVQTGTAWQNVENAEIETVAKRKIFWVYARATGDASSEIALRTYAYASFLLTYNSGYAMFQEALSTPSGFPVMPETGLLPMRPRTTATDVSGYQGAGGAYMREFAACYYHGNYVNACAVVVNPTASTVPVPSTSYAHSMVLSGSGVLDGGTASFHGAAVTSLAPGTAAILLP